MSALLAAFSQRGAAGLFEHIASARDTSVTAIAKKTSAQTWFLAAVLAASCTAVSYIVFIDAPQRQAALAGPPSRQRLEDIPFDGAQAYEYLKEICDLGPRISGTPGMTRQQELLRRHFEKLGAKVTLQPFRRDIRSMVRPSRWPT